MTKGRTALLALGLVGCAVSNSAYVPERLAIPASPNAYTAAPRAMLHGELFACNSGGGANLGELGARGEVARYTPYIFTPAGALLRSPTEAACLSSGFGWRGTASGGGRQHSGLDLANPGGG
jgi:murein DD-endopeptidase MepM/ murein hydrolase activator NlpD